MWITPWHSCTTLGQVGKVIDRQRSWHLMDINFALFQVGTLWKIVPSSFISPCRVNEQISSVWFSVWRLSSSPACPPVHSQWRSSLPKSNYSKPNNTLYTSLHQRQNSYLRELILLASLPLLLDLQQDLYKQIHNNCKTVFPKKHHFHNTTQQTTWSCSSSRTMSPESESTFTYIAMIQEEKMYKIVKCRFQGTFYSRKVVKSVFEPPFYRNLLRVKSG